MQADLGEPTAILESPILHEAPAVEPENGAPREQPGTVRKPPGPPDRRALEV